MALERQFVVEILDAQGATAGRVSVSGFNVVASSVTGTSTGAATSLATFTGNGQSGVVGAAITVPPSVRVTDANGLPVAGSTVTWLPGGGSGVTSTGNTSTTNSNGVAQVGSWTMGTLASGSSYSLLAYSGNLTNSPLKFVVTSVASGSAFSLAISGGTSQTTTPTGAWLSRGSVLVTDQYANILSNATVTLTTEDTAATLPASTITTNTSGVAGFTYTVGTSAQTASIFANLLSSATSVTFTSTTTSGAANNITIISGDGQTALSGSSLANAIILNVDDGFGNPVGSGNTLNLVVVLGSGSISSTTLTPVASSASFAWKMGATAGTNAVEISLQGVSGSTVTAFASGTNPVADTIQYLSGGTQTATVATALAVFEVATLGSGSSASGQAVAWAITSSNQTGSLSTIQTRSSTSGIARCTLTLGQTVGAYQVTASAGALTGSPVVFNATATADSATSLVLTTQPLVNTQVATSWSQQPVVVSTDVYGNLVSTNTRVQAVLFTSPVPNGTLGSSTSDFATCSGATATFSGLSYNGSGPFQTCYRCNSLSTATANQQNGAPPFASQLGFTTQPSDTIQGSVFSPTVVVAVQDSNGQTVTTATNQVTIAISGAGALNGTLSQNAVAGLATFPNVGPTAGTATGNYTLAATATGLTGTNSASIAVQATSGSHPNEPAGMTQITENDFNLPYQVGTTAQGLIGAGWYSTAGGVTLVTDQTDMVRLTVGAYRMRYTVNTVGGQAPCNYGKAFATNEKGTEIYVDFDFKVDPNWSGNNSGVNKMMFLTAGGISAVPFCFSATGAGLNPLQLQIRLQGCPGGIGGNAAGGTRNVAAGPAGGIVRGTKFRVEAYFKMNTTTANVANADGIAKVWFNGSLFLNSTTMAYIGNTNVGGASNGLCAPGSKWDQIKVNPTYGGGTPNPPYTQDFWLGYLYASTK